MPISPTTISDLKKTTAQLDFLLTASNIKLKNIPPNDRLCVICQSPFSKHVWKPSSDNTKTPVNRPVQLSCGHIFGLSCLAHLIFTTDFHNRCPLCRAEIIPSSFTQNPSLQSWKAAAPLLRMLMMFGGGERSGFEKNMVLDVLLNGLEKEGLTGPSQGKHMHRIMVLYEEFLGQFCDEPPPPMDDADRLAGAEERVENLGGIVRASQESSRMREELRFLEGRRQELARSEAEREVRDVREELRGVREELRESREALRDAEEELEEVRKKGRGMEKELQGVKRELMDVEDKDRKEWEEVVSQLEEIERKLQCGFEEPEKNARKKVEGAEKESLMAIEKALERFEEIKESPRAKAALAWFLSLLALVLALVWVYL